MAFGIPQDVLLTAFVFKRNATVAVARTSARFRPFCASSDVVSKFITTFLLYFDPINTL